MAQVHTVKQPSSQQEKVSGTVKTMSESRTEQLTQLLAEQHINTDSALEPLFNHLPDSDRNSSAYVGPTSQPHFHDTQSPAMSHNLTDAQRPRDPHGKEAERERGDPVHAVIGTTELLIMILSHLSTRDLTRALTVSKNWHNVILDPGSKELRRILFLEPVQTTEYLEFRSVFTRTSYKGNPAIIHEPSDCSARIVGIHPVLLPIRDHYSMAYTKVLCTQLGEIRSVPPFTYLSQPPLEEIAVWAGRRYRTIRAAGGLTFGALLEELTKQRQPPGGKFFIMISKAISMAEEDVKIARTAEAMEQLYAEKEKMRPEVFQYNRSRVWEGRPAVSEAEFERLKILGIVGPTTTQELDALLDSELRLSWN